MSDDFFESARLLSAGFALDGSPVDRSDYERVRSGLRRFLLVRYRTLGPDELLDIVDEAMLRLLRESRRQGRELQNPSGWLITVAGRLALDALGKLGGAVDREHRTRDDDEIARMIDRAASKESLRVGIERAIAHQDRICVHVVTAWLDLAAETGKEPPSRDVGDRCGVSHTTVNNALARFRSYLPRPD
jgi:DNA-directed RNA polymerase specialized sigma24 family protein